MLKRKLCRQLFTLLALTLLFYGCESKDKGGSGEKKGGGRGRGAGKTVPVRTMALQAKDLPHTIELVTVLSGRHQADVYSRVAGNITSLGPEEGQPVKAGETLFRIERSDTPGEFFLATPVTSPINGWVGRRLINSIGAQVTAQQAVVTVVDDETLRASVPLPTDEWLRVSHKTATTLRIGEQVRAAKVIGIARNAETSSSRGTVTVETNNKDHRWKAGMVAMVRFDLDVKPRIVVPASAVSITDQGAFVFAVKEGKAQRLPVTFRVIDNDSIEIIDGAKDGTEIIVEGVNQVGDGLPVKVVMEKQGDKPS